LKILNVNRFYHLRGGADRYYFALAGILERFGHQVVPFSTTHPKNIPSEYEQYFVRGFTEDNFRQLSLLNKSKVFFNGVYSFEAKRKISRLIENQKPDIAHLHGLFYQISLSVIDKLYEKEIPIVYSLHDYHTICANSYLHRNGKECQSCRGGSYSNIISAKCYRNSFLPSVMAYLAKKLHRRRKTLEKITFFTVPHKYMRDILVDWGFEKAKIKIILNPFIYDDIAPYAYNPGSDYFVFYGRIAELKGIFTVLEAFKRLKNIQLKIFGSGPAVGLVHRFVLENRLDNVSLDTKLRWGRQLKDIIGKSIAVISASKWPAPSEYVNYESMALGKPIIASDALGNLDMIEDGGNGYIYRKDDFPDLMEKIKLLLESNIAAMGRKSRALLEQKVSVDKFYHTLIAIYEDAVKQREEDNG